MPREKNPVRRFVATLIVVLIGTGILAIAVFGPGGSPSNQQTPAQQVETATPSETPDESEVEVAQDATPSDPPATTDPVDAVAAGDQPSISPVEESDSQPAPAGSLTGLRARVFPAGQDFGAIGGIDASAGDRLQLAFTPYGAGVESITLASYYKTVKRTDNYEVQEQKTVSSNFGPLSVASLASVGVEITSEGAPAQFIDLRTTSDGAFWQAVAPGHFQAVIENENGDPVARIDKRYSLREDAYEIDIDQHFENLSGQPLTIRWYQYGPVDMPIGDAGYGGDKRRLSLGGIPAGATLPQRIGGIYSRSKALKRADKADGQALLWPSPGAEYDLTWVAAKNRYFTFAVVRRFSDSETAAARPNRTLDQVEEIYAIVLGRKGGGPFDERVLALQFNGPAIPVSPATRADLSIAAYAGPTSSTSIAKSPGPDLAGLDRLVIYNFGGPCAFCTFQWLTQILLWFLNFVHSYIVFDWALSIMLLVLVVRSILHPITKKSQIGMQRFSKHMQELQPKMEKIKERYRNDPKRQQQELLKLQREEGMGLQHMLGCFPMFLQTPVWIALYAMLFFVFELRHEPAFFGVFQAITGGRWNFLSDLSAPDQFISFGRSILTIPLFGDIESINILPFFLGLVFFLQQKYLTPPTTANLTPEQKSQQKMIKIMMVILFPVIMYNAPSGLSIYFITNSTLGILESRYIRAHIDQMDLTPQKKQPPKKKVANQAVPASPFSKNKDPKGGQSYKQRRKK